MANKMEPVNSEAPPSYVEATGAASISQYRSQIAQYASQLPEAIRQNQYGYQSQQEEQDFECMAQLLPEVCAFLSYIATLPRQPSVAELVLVPESTVPELWTLSGGEEQRKQGDVVQVVRIRDRNPKNAKNMENSGEGTGSPAKAIVGEFDEWGRWPESTDSPNTSGGSALGGYWWRDETMARRLSAHFSLSSNGTHKADPNLPAAVPVSDTEIFQGQKKKRGSWLPWSTNKKKQASVSTRLPMPESGKIRMDEVSMTAHAEEITFRKQNELGIYESLTGWAIVLRVSCA